MLSIYTAIRCQKSANKLATWCQCIVCQLSTRCSKSFDQPSITKGNTYYAQPHSARSLVGWFLLSSPSVSEYIHAGGEHCIRCFQRRAVCGSSGAYRWSAVVDRWAVHPHRLPDQDRGGGACPL